MNSYSTLIDQPREDKRLSWPCWLTYSGRLTNKAIIRPASSQAQDRESSPVKDQCSTTVLRRQLKNKARAFLELELLEQLEYSEQPYYLLTGCRQ